jgi:Ankyrin repeats (3 copies)
LLAQFHLNSLARKDNLKALRITLANLPRELDDTYNEAMQRIRSQDDEKVKRAEQVLSWISFASRPLTVTELQHALAVEPKDTEFDEDSMLDEDVLVSVCSGLVVIDQESNVIRLVHYTTKEYFERVRMAQFPCAQTNIAMTCLTYISFDAFAKGYCLNDRDMNARLREYPFLNYAAKYWGDHAREGPEEVIKELALEFLNYKSKLMCSEQAMHLSRYRYVGYSQGFRKRVTALHIVASIGLAKIVQKLLERENVDVNSVDSYGRMPLSYAAKKGHEPVVKLLLGVGVWALPLS